MPYTEINQSKLYYERRGNGPALVLIHGLGSSVRDWALQMEDFAQDHSVLAMDLPGHGRSEGLGEQPVTIAGLARSVAMLMDRQGMASADIVGLSLGGAVAFQLATHYPDKVRSLTIANSSPAFVAKSWRERWMVWQRLLVIRLLGMARMARILAKRLFPADPDLQALFVERFGENDKRSYLRTLHALIGWSVESQLSAIECPTLVVSADQDYTPVADKQAYVERMPNARLVVIPDSHHAMTMERPDAFNGAVRRFLDTLSADAPPTPRTVAGAAR